MNRSADLDRFWSKVEKTATCWLWRAGTTHNGYGYFQVSGASRRAHRWIYEQTVGPIPSGMQLDHLCRVRECVNPKHLEPVTPQINTLRGEGEPALNAAKSACHKGHEFTEANTYLRGGRSGRKRRVCRECERERDRRRYHAQRV